MRESDFSEHRSGRVVRIPEGGVAFVPDPLPPERFRYDADIVYALSEADAALGRLDGMAHLLPDSEVLIEPFLRREAVMSSRIEGTQTTFPGLLLFEAAQTTNDARDPEAQEVANYVTALRFGLRDCRDRPIDRKLICALHDRLLTGTSNKHHRPGTIRSRQVYIAPHTLPIREARYVPPPPRYLDAALRDFQKFLREQNNLPLLIRMAFTHYQFEAIHPFVDGNGRVGRLLLALQLCIEGRLSSPMLYLSVYFERNRLQYYDLLLDVSRKGRWSEWVLFFLRGVREQAEDAVRRIRQLLDLREDYRKKFSAARSTTIVWRLIDQLFAYPVITAPMVQRRLSISYPTARDVIGRLTEAHILKQFEYSARAHYFMAHEIVDVIDRPVEERFDEEASDVQMTQEVTA